MRRSHIRIVSCWMVSLLGCSVSAPADAEGTHAEIKHMLKRNSDDKIQADHVDNTPIQGLFQVVAKGQILFTDSTGRYVIVDGHLIDLNEKRDLSLDSLSKTNFSMFSSLPLELATKEVRGSGKYHLAIFEDKDCASCAIFRTFLNTIPDITIYSFDLTERAAPKKTVAQAASIIALADKLKVLGTPTMIFENGVKYEGLIPPEEFFRYLMNR